MKEECAGKVAEIWEFNVSLSEALGMVENHMRMMGEQTRDFFAEVARDTGEALVENLQEACLFVSNGQREDIGTQTDKPDSLSKLRKERGPSGFGRNSVYEVSRNIGA